MATLDRFSWFLFPTRETTLITAYLPPCILWSKFISYRVDPFSEGRQNHFDRVPSPESGSLPLNPQDAKHNICHLLCLLPVTLKVIVANSVDPDQTVPLGAV